MKKICFVTGTRADYGIMAPIMREVAKSSDAILQIIATNMHMSEDYGMTVKEIERDGFTVDIKLASLAEGGDSKAAVLTMAKTEEGLANAFERLKPDIVVILGDRYEALAAASAAVVFNIPVAHLHGGETTEGAIDNKIRHAITQLSTWHFAATPEYVEKIISMGVSRDKVYHSGAPGAEVKEEGEDKNTYKFYDLTGIRPEEEFILLAFHPVTLLPDKGELELKATLEALETFVNQGYKVLVTMPNSDPGTFIISSILERWVKENKGKVISVKSLGAELFHQAMEQASAIVGNSSAALIEAPSHRLPAVNIGIRQQGRTRGVTVINTKGEKEAVEKALKMVLSMEMKSVVLGMPVNVLNPYFKENAASEIASILINQ